MCIETEIVFFFSYQCSKLNDQRDIENKKKISFVQHKTKKKIN